MPETIQQKNNEYIIRPPRSWFSLEWAELVRYKELLSTFVWRNIKVRYKQTAIGVAWAVLQPLLTMIIFSVFFGRLAKIPSDGIPYPIFVFAGLLYWNLFSSALTNASSSMVESSAMIQKIYFPRLILPLSAILTPMIDFAISFVVLAGVMAWYRFIPGWHGIVLLPLFMGMTIFSVLGLGLWLCSLNVKYRDVRYALPFFIQILLFVTPVIYPVSIIPQRFQWIAYLNPMTGVITAARSSLLGNASVDWTLLAISFVTSIVLFLFGLWYFKKTEQFFADVI